MKTLLLLWSIVVVITADPYQRNARRFPDDFVFGAATASYQIEGAWNSDDKGENIWDHMTHTQPDIIKDSSNGDVAADSYHQYKRDVEMMRELGLDAYRFSLSWPRIMPTGMPNQISEAGINFYNKYINEMLKYNIQPLVTLYHWDLPQKLQNLGGFTNPLVVDWFEDYARVVYENFGDRVKSWITFNEPYQICYQGYDTVTKAPRVNVTGIGGYMCAKNLMMAHARAYHLYNNEFKAAQNGEVGITVNINWYGAGTDSEEDEFAAEITRQAEWGLYVDPIFSRDGGFPKDLADRIEEKSKEQGFLRSRLPEFSYEERNYVRGASDFLGINHYTGWMVSAEGYDNNDPVPSLYNDLATSKFYSEEWLQGASVWMRLWPRSLYNVLIHVMNKYDNPVMMVTENGWSQRLEDGLSDDDRITYYRSMLQDVLDALDEGANMKAYMAWSLMDNFEWMNGYTERFGLYEVNFDVPERTRTPRKSAFVYKEIIKSRVIDPEYNPDFLTMTIDEGN